MYMIYICDLTITKGSSGFGPLSHAHACALPLSYKLIFRIAQPPALPVRLQTSTIGRAGLNRRVRYGNGCVPGTHRHAKYLIGSSAASAALTLTNQTAMQRPYSFFSLERR